MQELKKNVFVIWNFSNAAFTYICTKITIAQHDVIYSNIVSMQKTTQQVFLRKFLVNNYSATESWPRGQTNGLSDCHCLQSRDAGNCTSCLWIQKQEGEQEYSGTRDSPEQPPPTVRRPLIKCTRVAWNANEIKADPSISLLIGRNS